MLAVSSEGKMLAFKVSDLPEMPRGKGNKIYDISGKKAKRAHRGAHRYRGCRAGGKLALWSGEKQKTLEFKELADYRGQRAQRGAVLTRGWRGIDRLEGIQAEKADA